MRLFSTVLLSVSYALILSAFGYAIVITAIPPWFNAIFIPCALFFAVRFAKYEEEIVLLPFAAAGALFSFGSGVTTGVGVLMAIFALIGFANANGNGTILGLRALLVWLAAAVVCASAPYGLLRLSSTLFSTLSPTVVSGLCGLLAFLVGIFFFRLHLKAKKKKREPVAPIESGKSQSETKASVHTVDLKMWSEPGWDKLRDHIREEISQDTEKEKAEDPNDKK